MIRKALPLIVLFAALIASGSAQTQRYLYCDTTNMVAAGHVINVECWDGGYGIPLRADLVPLSMNEAVALFRGTTQDVDVSNRGAVASATLHVLKENSNELGASLTPPGPGAYGVRIYLGDTLRLIQFSAVSRFGIMGVGSSNLYLYAPVDLTTGRFVREKLNVVRVAPSSAPQSLRRAADNVYEDAGISHHEAYGTVVYAQAPDGSVSLTSPSGYWGYWAPNARISFAQTDRPVYRPGDKVSLRAILRDGSIGNYRLVRKPVVVDVEQGYPSRLIARRTLTPDDFGSVATDMQLPADAALGEYAVQIDGARVGTFEVQAYKKPEYTLSIASANPYVIAGDDAAFTAHLTYLFGGSAANLKLHYRAYTNYYDGDWFGPFSSWHSRDDSASAEGDTSTNAAGEAAIRIPTKREGLDGSITLDIDARDESGRTVSERATLSVVRATYHVLVEPATWIGVVNAPNLVNVRALSHDGSPRKQQQLHVKIVQARYERDAYRETVLRSFDIQTDDRGNARFTYEPALPAEYRFEVSGIDERGDALTSSQWQWVSDPESAWAPHVTQPQIIPAKTTFAAGERLRATLVLVRPAHEALVTVASDRLVTHTIVPINGLTGTIDVPAPRDAQRVGLTACIPDDPGIACARAQLLVASETTLKLSVTPEKAQYRPGQLARMHLHVEDTHGRPVRAQLSVGVVDEGIYAIATGSDGDPNAAFYERTTYISADANWYHPNTHVLKTIARVSSRSAGELVRSGVASDVYSVNSASANGVPAGGNLNRAYSALAGTAVRTRFADTAYWAPSVVSDAKGDATVTFTWPENLTTWRATTVGVTVRTQLGTAQADVMVTKPLLARLEIPRFLRAGDRATVTGIVHGPKAGEKALMQFDPGALGVMLPPVEVALDSSRRASSTWALATGGVGQANLALRASDGDDSDGIQLPLPLLGATPMGHERAAGLLSESVEIPLNLGPGELAGALHVSFAPSMIAQLAQTLRVFDVYPYYCTEQTSSNGIVAAALMLAGAKQQSLAIPNDPKGVIEKARAKLAELRHSDSAWGWWSTDQTSLFMTGYAVYAQDLMDRATGTKYDYMLTSGADALARLLKFPTDRDTENEVALAAYALARTKPTLIPSDTLPKLEKHLDRKDVVTIALTGLADSEAGRKDSAERAAQILLARATMGQGGMFWHESEWSWRWWSDPIEATSLGALLLHETNHEKEAQQALAFIRAQREGDWWYTTLDTAMASIAIAQIEGPDAGATPNETARVIVDGKVAATVRVASLLPDASETHVVIPAAVMRGAHAVSVEREGSGRLYWASDFEKYDDASAGIVRNANEGVLTRLFAKPPAISVNRVYSVGHQGAWRVGDDVFCDLWITARDGAEYVTLEDPFPAGTEYQLPQHDTGSWWSGDQFLDDHAAFFFRYLYAGETVHLTYHLRATTPGSFAAPGPSAFASYGPPVAGVGTGERVTIEP